MQTLSIYPQLMVRSETEAFPLQNGSSISHLPTHYDYIEASRNFQNTEKKTIQLEGPTRDKTMEDVEFLRMASEALTYDSDSKGTDEFEFRQFRSNSTEPSFQLDFPLQRTDDQVRNEYIERLRYLKVMRDDHPKPHQTITIFDWDDTILPTSYLYHIGMNKISPHLEMRLKELDLKAAKLLSKAAKVSKVWIVTNSADSWVESSSKRFLPLTYETIMNKQIPVISARAEYEDIHPNDPKQWKMESFLDIGDALDSNVLTNIICLGDSEFEMQAAKRLSRKFNQSLVKTLKFKERPSVEELIKEMEAIHEKFDQVYTTLKTLNIKLSRKN